MPKETPKPLAADAPAAAAARAKAKSALLTVEQLRDAAETPAWLFAAAKMKHGWPVGAELTEAQYQKALKEAADEPIGHVPLPKHQEDEVSE